VEDRPGKKNHAKVREFLATVTQSVHRSGPKAPAEIL
jgi:hypothetical protein